MIRIPSEKIASNKFESISEEIVCKIKNKLIESGKMQEIQIFIVDPDVTCVDDMLKELVSKELDELFLDARFYFSEYFKFSRMKDYKFYMKNNLNLIGNSKNNREKFIDKFELDLQVNEPFRILFFPDFNSEEFKKYNNSISVFEKKISQVYENFNRINTFLDEIIEYSFFEEKMLVDGSKCKIRQNLIRELGVKSCPYCDLLQLEESDDRSKSTIDLDHFLPQSRYPLFSCSLGNIVPSCKNCNSTYKSQYDLPLINPRVEGFEQDARFNTILKSGVSYSEFVDKSNFFAFEELLEIVIPISSGVDSIKKKRIQNTIELFELRQRYNMPETLNIARCLIKGIRKHVTSAMIDTYEEAAIIGGEHIRSISKKIINDIYIDLGDSYDNVELLFTHMPKSKLRNDLTRTFYDIVKS